MYTKIEKNTFENKHHMSANAVLYNIPNTGTIPMFVSQYQNIPNYVDGEKTHVIRKSEVNRLDNIAYTYYGTPEFIWIIMAVNNILDPFNIKENTVLRILPKNYIEYNLLRYNMAE